MSSTTGELPLVSDHASQNFTANVEAHLRWFSHPQPPPVLSLPTVQLNPVTHLLMFAFGFLLSHDEHDPCGGHEREGQDGEDGDEKRLDEVEEIVFLFRLWRIRSEVAEFTNTQRKYDHQYSRDNHNLFICHAAFMRFSNSKRRNRLNDGNLRNGRKEGDYRGWATVSLVELRTMSTFQG